MKKDLHISFGSYSDTGLVKEFNTDAVLEFKILDGHVFVVCDGHNGNDGHGALAAKLLAESIKKYFYNRSYKDMAKALTNAITFANLALFEQSQKDEKYKGIGSTLAIAIYREGELYYAYAGDSRIYLYRNDKLQPLTRDHVANLENPVDSEVKVLIGRSKDIKFGVCKTPLKVVENDVFMLCTDGLTDLVSEAEISEVLSDEDKAPEHKSKNLIELARDKGGNDCTSVHVIDFSQIIELQKPKAPLNLKPLLYGVVALVGVALFGLGAYKGYEAIKNRPKKVIVEEPVIKPTESKNVNKEKIAKVEGDKSNTAEKKAENPNQQKANANKKEEPKVNKGDVIYHDHVIKYGENLYRLALKYNTTQKLLTEINGNKATKLVAGTKLKIPIQANHKVKSGESFSTISNKYNVKIKVICSASDVNENAPLKEGQMLIIPLQSKK